MIRVSGYGGVRFSFLLSEIGKLSKFFPPALAVLKERRDRAQSRMLASATDRDPAVEFAAINWALEEDYRTLEAFDSLSKGDVRRQALGGLSLQRLLIDAKRYADVLEVNPYDKMITSFNLLTSAPRESSNAPDPAAAVKTRRLGVVKLVALNVEVLAGAGELSKAREFALKVLSYDNSAETQQVLQKHLERAGHPNLLAPGTP